MANPLNECYQLITHKKHNKINDILTKHDVLNERDDSVIWRNRVYYLRNNGENNLDKPCITYLNQNDLLDLLNALKSIMKYHLWEPDEIHAQLLSDMSYWRRSICVHGDECINQLNYKCGYFHSRDKFITPDLSTHYNLYPSYIPNGRKTKLYNVLFDIDGKRDNYALTLNELRILPCNHRKIFTWLHIRIVTDLRKKQLCI